MRNVISGHVGYSVTLGRNGYGDALTITGTGVILPSYDAAGIYVPARLSHASIINQGSVSGGNGYEVGGDGAPSGGVGVDLTGPGIVANAGVITGGIGGQSVYGTGGPGGTGLKVDGVGDITNSGVILGGYGGEGYYTTGKGGDGVDLGDGTLINTGIISGGGNSHRYGYGYGGVGVDLAGGTLISAGTISGGASYQGGPAADAVLLGGNSGTLVIDPGAVFNGLVVADGVADQLVLAGASSGAVSGTISGIGTEYTGFSTIHEHGAHWTLAGSNTLAPGETLTLAGSLTVAGTLSGGEAAFAPGHHETLAIGAQASVTTTLSGFAADNTIDVAKFATSLTFIGGTLTLYDGQSAIETLSLAGNYTQAEFHLAGDGHGGTAITLGGFVAAEDSRAVPAIYPGAWASSPQADLHATGSGWMCVLGHHVL